MTVKLTPKMKKLIDKRVKAGSYATPEDVLMAGLAALEHQDVVEQFAPGELQSLVDEGEESVRKHGLLDGEEAFRARRRRRLQRRRKSA